MPSFVDRTGFRVGRLTVVKLAERRGKNNYWLCVCDCGESIEVRAGHLSTGGIQSCGCLQRELFAKRRFIHGGSRTDLYRIWRNIKERCTNPKSKSYEYYGGRGIQICPEWLDNFAQFAKDMGPRPDGTSIDRIDNNGNYESSNCRWATRTQQNRNKRSNALATIDGVTASVAEWAERYSMNLRTVWSRIYDLGWSPERAVTEPVQAKASRK